MKIHELDGYIKAVRALYIGAISSVAILTLLTLSFIFPFTDSDGEIQAAGNTLNSNATLSINTGSEKAKMELSVNKSSGTFSTSSDSNKAKFNVITDNNTGYTLSIVGTNSTGDLINTTIGTEKIASITSPISGATFDNSSYNGKWGIQPSKYNSVSNSNYLPAPTTDPLVMDTTSAPNTSANNYSIGMGARADFNTPSGVYTASFIINATGNPVMYSIEYVDDTEDNTIAHLPEIQSSVVASNTIALSTQIPTRDNYTFAHWCYGEAKQNGTVCDGTAYDAGADFDLEQVAENTITLHAIWSPNVAIKTNTGVTSVTLNGTTCNSSDSEASTIGCVVKNLEYGQSYTLVATMEDGYKLTSWDPGNGTVANAAIAETTFSPGDSPTTVVPTAEVDNSYTITLKNKYATTAGSTSASIEYGSRDLSPITNPERTYTVSGFSTDYNNASGATVSDTDTRTSTYAFDGWYDGDTRVITPEGALEPNTPYTDAFGKWSVNEGATLTAKWGNGSYVSLPSIYKSNWNCGWTTIQGTSSIQYSSGYSSLTPAGNMVIYGVCYRYSANIYFTFQGDGIESVKVCLVEGDCTGSDLVGKTTSTGSVSGVYMGEEYYLYPTFADGYQLDHWQANWGMSPVITTESSSTDLNPKIRVKSGYGGQVKILGRTTCIKYSGYMQNFNPQTGDDYCGYGTLTDARDGQDYNVAMLNGTLWMTRNLAIGCNGSGKTYGNEIIGGTLDNIGTNITEDSWVMPTDSLSGSGDSRTEPRMECNSTYGAWYNSPAAVAMTGYGTYDIHDICPAGWRLPGKQSADINSNTYLFDPVLAGEWNDGELGYTSEAYYWTSELYGENSWTGRYIIDYDQYGPGISMAGDLDYGRNIRCILSSKEGTIQGITYLQEVTPSIVSKSNNRSTATLIDSRDGQEYTVGKLNNNLWMTRNLAIGCDGSGSSYGSNISPITLTAESSNVGTTSWSTPSASLSLGNSYDEARIECDGNRGAWYNYVAATAGTITGSSNTTEDVYNVCPKGWTLPNYDQVIAATGTKFTTPETLFNPNSIDSLPLTGTYYASTKVWWSATPYDGSETNRAGLFYYSSENKLYGSSYERNSGFPIRCVAKNS